jgi:hypothetical protein
MTTLATRPDHTPVTINADFTDTTVAPGTPVYVHNPHLISLVGAAFCTLIAGTGTAWSLYGDNPRSDLAFALLLALIFILTVTWRRFWAWDER